MTPVVELKEKQRLQLFLSHHHASSSLSASNFFNSTQHQSELPIFKFHDSHHHHHQDVVEYISKSRSSDPKPSSSSSSSFEAAINDSTEFYKPVKYTLRFQDHHHQYTDTNHTTTRICSDCNTTNTPLWRSGPKGPKSLCNACGIRQRKARRAMAAAAMGNDGAVVSWAKSNKVQNKEKKWRTRNVTQSKKLCKAPDPLHLTEKTKICFNNFGLGLSKKSGLPRVFPQDVEEAAILLMELSCGFIHG